MSTSAQNSPAPGKYDGVLQIIRYNWSLYALTFLAATSCIAAGQLLRSRAGSAIALLGVALVCWMAISLLASHYIYDRSSLYDFRWMLDKLPRQPSTWVNIHCGLDQSSHLLLSLFPGAKSQILDVFDPSEMTEPSIARARGGNAAPSETVAVDFRALPAPPGSCDAVFLIFAAHELRNRSSRREFFVEIARVLSATGTVVMIEHLRDLPNFAAFGPGFLHFQSRREWINVAASTDLALVNEFSITPFVRVFLFTHKDHD
jgi:SAM-dependent methyltransferase